MEFFVGSAIAVTGILVTIYYARKAHQERPKTMKQNQDKSPGSIQISGDSNRANVTYQSSDSIPDIKLIIYGNGYGFLNTAILNHSEKTLIAEEISIMGVRTPLNQEFRKQKPIPDPAFPEKIFTTKVKSIPVVLTYRTISGEERYGLYITGTQEPREGDGRYNVVFKQPATIRRLKK